MRPTDDEWAWEPEPDPPAQRVKAALLAAWRGRLRTPEMTVARCAVFLVVTHVVAGVTVDGTPTPDSLRELSSLLTRGFGGTAALGALAAGLLLWRDDSNSHPRRAIRTVLIATGTGTMVAGLSQVTVTVLDEEVLLSGAEWLTFWAYEASGIVFGLAIIALGTTRTHRRIAL